MSAFEPQKRSLSINIFNNSGYSLSAAHTGCHNTVFFLLSFQFMGELDRQFTTGAAQGMAQGDGAAIGVYGGRVQSEYAYDGQRLGGEGLIEFYQVDLSQGHPGLSQGFGDGLYGTNAHDTGMDSGAG